MVGMVSQTIQGRGGHDRIGEKGDPVMGRPVAGDDIVTSISLPRKNKPFSEVLLPVAQNL